jgi:hypothetical protein
MHHTHLEDAVPLNDYLLKTAALMKDFHIRIRDTYIVSSNLDDFYINGDRLDGPRHVKIEWVETDGFSEVKAKKIYGLQGYSSAAYDTYRIVVPNRYQRIGRDDPIIHECVHFLQHTTVDEEQRYVKFTGQNHAEYLGQRVELEAHIIQLAYIFAERSEYRDRILTTEDKVIVNEILHRLRAGDNVSISVDTLLLCRERGLI